jgi:hypothetical protein
VIGGQLWLIRVPREFSEEASRVVERFRPQATGAAREARPLPRSIVVAVFLGLLLAIAAKLCH